MSQSFVSKPCPQCPFRRDVKPFLRTDRAEELAYHAENPYNSFPCHKTLDHDDDGDTIQTQASKECAGFLTLRAYMLGEERVHEIKDGFKPDYENVYEDAWEMTDAYAEENGD